VGETFRLLNGQKTMIKINGQWGGAEEAAYLHSGESKVLNGTDLVVRRKVSMTDHGDE
jgi:hypothetical protein